MLEDWVDVDDGREISFAYVPGYGDGALWSTRRDGAVLLYFSRSAWAAAERRRESMGEARKSRGANADAVVVVNEADVVSTFMESHRLFLSSERGRWRENSIGYCIAFLPCGWYAIKL
jgi:hypothetical protein